MRWIGGFEGADHVNGRGQPLAMARDSGHLDRIDLDYARLRRLGFSEVRESVGWRISEQAGRFDFDSLHRRAQAAARHGLRIRWTCMHYGVPDDLDLLDPDTDTFVARFAHFCKSVASALVEHASSTSFYTPINEISFLSWAATSTGLIHPHTAGTPAR